MGGSCVVPCNNVVKERSVILHDGDLAFKCMDAAAESYRCTLDREKAGPLRQRSPKEKFRAAALGITAARRFRLDPRTRRSYVRDWLVDQEAIRQMDQDIPRTASSEPKVRARLGWIRAVLLRQLAEDPQLGYCQGMNLVAAAFAIAAGSQGEAYARFHAFVEKLRGLWLPGFPLLAVGTDKFVEIARGRPWYKHLHANAVEPSMFLPQALMTVFAMWLPMPTVVRCLALPECNGLKGMLAMALAVLDHTGGLLLKQQNMEELLKVFKGLQSHAPTPSVLEAAASVALAEVHSSKAFTAEKIGRSL